MINDLINQMVEAGVHLGHQTRKWHPSMKKYLLKDKAGILSEILTIFANCGANILTINQSIPTGGRAMVTISAETSNLNCNIEALTQQIAERTGVVKADCVAG